jgi:uncharacterized membrane protein YwaF
MHPPFPNDPDLTPLPIARRADNWLRYSAERAASIGLILLLATGAAIVKQRAYRTLLGAALLSANLALILALVSRWRRPASGAWSLFICCAVVIAMAIQLAVLSAMGLFPVSE